MPRTEILLAMLLVVTAPAAARADNLARPYASDPAGIAQAAALARILARAEALSALSDPARAAAEGASSAAAAVDGDAQAADGSPSEAAGEATTADDDALAADGEPAMAADDLAADAEEEGGVEHDLAMVRASLAAAAPDIAAALDAALAASGSDADDATRAPGADDATAAEDDASAMPLPGLVEIARRAAAALALAGADPHRDAALIAELLLAEGGVAESYEEAVDGDEDAYAMGYAVLRQVAALWVPLRADADARVAADVDASLARLAALFPGPAQPLQLSPDPEEAEAPAQAIVGLLEVATASDLYPGRDLAAAIGLVESLASAGCDLSADGKHDLAAERVAIAAAYSARLLAPTLAFVAPEPAEAIEAGFDALADGDAPGGCTALTSALGEARTAVAQP